MLLQKTEVRKEMRQLCLHNMITESEHLRVYFISFFISCSASAFFRTNTVVILSQCKFLIRDMLRRFVIQKHQLFWKYFSFGFLAFGLSAVGLSAFGISASRSDNVACNSLKSLLSLTILNKISGRNFKWLMLRF